MLKATVDSILREKHRSLSWLAKEMTKTFDGLRLSLINESIKYKDIVLMAGILEVSPSIFFKQSQLEDQQLGESTNTYGTLSATQEELINTLKDQIKDKDRIIKMLDSTK